MSVLLTGLLGVAINVVPDLFKLIAGEREGEISEEAIEIVKRFVDTDDEEEAARKLDEDPVLKAELRKHLADLAFQATVEQNRAEEEQRRIDLEFVEQEIAERDRQHKAQLDVLNADLESTMQARAHAMEMAKSEKWWIAGINPALSLIITFGFLGALYLIMDTKLIANKEIFYTAIGALATAFATVIGFHFGSSSGSKQKDMMIRSQPETDQPLPPQNGSDAGGSTDAGGGAQDPQSVPVPLRKPAIPVKPDPGGRFGLFVQKAPGIMQDLMNDFGVSKFQAAGILGNIGHECAGFRKMQEIKPIVKGSRGGWGWCQWTGPRRRAFEAWCEENGHDNLSADDANYGFLKHELETTEKNALKHLRSTQSLADATKSFMDKFERPGVKHLESRIKWARKADEAHTEMTG